MAETRKHRVEVRDELDKALYAALGQPVRPTEPGPGASDPERASEDQPADPERPSTSFVAPGSTIAGFTFGPGTPSRS